MEYKFPVIVGGITGEEFLEYGDCIVYPHNATSARPYEPALSLWEKYPFSKIERKSLILVNRAIAADRGTPGEIVLKSPPPCTNTLDDRPEDFLRPHLAALICQFSAGPCLEKNEIAQQQLERSLDTHYVRGLSKDTQQNRRIWFKLCLVSLGRAVIANGNIKRVILPQYIGMSRKQADEWHTEYLPLINIFQDILLKREIQTCLLVPSVSPYLAVPKIILDEVEIERGASPEALEREILQLSVEKQGTGSISGGSSAGGGSGNSSSCSSGGGGADVGAAGGIGTKRDSGMREMDMPDGVEVTSRGKRKRQHDDVDILFLNAVTNKKIKM